MPYQMRSDQAVIYKAGKREFAGGRKEETCGGKGKQDIDSSRTACFHSCYAARHQIGKRKKAGRVPHLNTSCCLLFGYPSPGHIFRCSAQRAVVTSSCFREVGGTLSTVHTWAKLLKAWLHPIKNIRRWDIGCWKGISSMSKRVFCFVFGNGGNLHMEKSLGEKPVNGDRWARNRPQNVRLHNAALKWHHVDVQALAASLAGSSAQASFFFLLSSSSC